MLNFKDYFKEKKKNPKKKNLERNKLLVSEKKDDALPVSVVKVTGWGSTASHLTRRFQHRFMARHELTVMANKKNSIFQLPFCNDNNDFPCHFLQFFPQIKQ